MSELLSPSGNILSFYAAIANGADAIYLGLDKYSARAYANNFTIESLKDLLDFAHLRNVKIYVTINTIIYDDELDDAFKTIDQLAKIGVDAIIVQDLAILNYITNNYKSLKAHASTQMGVDDIQGAKLVTSLGASRVVFARETPYQVIKDIKNKLNIEVEAFIHGALCVSYSGNCLMSSMIGDRSGNRGRCAGCCRRYYSLLNKDNKILAKGYLLSLKDLNTSRHIKDLSFIDSLKIEGRMKEPTYVGGVTSIYRNILDNTNKIDSKNLEKLFNRTFTKGYILGEENKNISNINKINNNGYYIGYVEKQYKDKIWIKLEKELSKGDQIIIELNSSGKEVSLPINKMFDYARKEIFSSNNEAIIYCNLPVNKGMKIYKVSDFKFNKDITSTFANKEYRKIPIDISVSAKINKPMLVEIRQDKSKIFYKSSFLVDSATSSPINKEDIVKQFSKIKDTPYYINNTNIDMDENIFVSIKNINEVRRETINKLNEIRLFRKLERNIPKEIIVKKYDVLDKPQLCVEVNNQEQYEAAKEMGIKHIYYKNIIPRNNANYISINNNEEVLVGGLGGLNFYKDNHKVITDYSFNIVNYLSVGLLSSLGAERITLSEEIDKDSINLLIQNYLKEYNTYPNLELIVYGYSKLMHSKYCLLNKIGLCRECKKNKFYLKDDYTTFPMTFNSDCTTNIFSDKPIDLLDQIPNIKGINYFRVRFTIESKQECINIIKRALDALENKINLDSKKKNNGHYFSRPL